MTLRSYGPYAFALILQFACNFALAEDPEWLPVRDQNPFVLGAGIPLLPEPLTRAGSWSVDAYIAEANTQLISGSPTMSVLFAAETRESRLSFSYALSDDWTARASLGDLWIGVGFLDEPIQHFHRLIGAPQGYRGGRLGVTPPYIQVTQDGVVLYQLDRPGQALAPLLLDLSRTWNISDRTSFGLSVAGKFSTGDTNRLSDTGGTGASATAFVDMLWRDDIHLGARLGFLHESTNDLLPTLARSSATFADVYASVPLFGQWRGELQYDVHSSLYRNVPNFLNYGGILSGGLTRPLGHGTELILGLSEDVPIAHTQDVVLEVALRIRPGTP
jgi:hypothetical protein